MAREQTKKRKLVKQKGREGEQIQKKYEQKKYDRKKRVLQTIRYDYELKCKRF